MHLSPQGRTGFKNRPEQFPNDRPHYRPSPGKIIKKSEITFFPRINDRFFNSHPTGHRALPKRKHGQSAPASPNISRSTCSVIGCVAKYELTKKCVVKECFVGK